MSKAESSPLGSGHDGAGARGERGKVFRALFDNTAPASLASRLRRRRSEQFRATLLAHAPNARILDAGGTPVFWRSAFLPAELKQYQIVCVNLDVQPTCDANIVSMFADARDLSAFANSEFDVAFSNSVIEHVGDWTSQSAMAAEIRRVAGRYWVQTPNRYFPLEPHFLFPGFQFLPQSARRAVARQGPFGWMPRGTPVTMEECDRIRLPTAREMRILFPDAVLHRERLGGLTKSLVAVRGDN
jgi:hypothetical protein